MKAKTMAAIGAAMVMLMAGNLNVKAAEVPNPVEAEAAATEAEGVQEQKAARTWKDLRWTDVGVVPEPGVEIPAGIPVDNSPEALGEVLYDEIGSYIIVDGQKLHAGDSIMQTLPDGTECIVFYGGTSAECEARWAAFEW